MKGMIRSQKELELMKQSGKITALALKKAIESARPGISLLEVEQVAEEEIKKLGAEPSFRSVPGYHWTTCLTVNDEVVHGLPRDIKLRVGDVLGIDVGALFKGWHTDSAWSVLVGGGLDKGLAEKKRFLQVGEDVLWKAISQAVEGKRVGDISATIQQGIERQGYSVVRSYAGHGVGRYGHEEPEIPEYGSFGRGLLLKAGMTLAVEVIYASGRGEVFETGDGWTVATRDRSLGGLFEMTVIVGKNKPEVLTDWRNS
ncbi:MAG: type I methionyl aminopeptidase [bacterium]|nr:type I methionyl aminopeptidase [bacterium]